MAQKITEGEEEGQENYEVMFPVDFKKYLEDGRGRYDQWRETDHWKDQRWIDEETLLIPLADNFSGKATVNHIVASRSVYHPVSR